MTPERTNFVFSEEEIFTPDEMRNAMREARRAALEEAARLVEDMSGSFDEFSPLSYAAAIRKLAEEK